LALTAGELRRQVLRPVGEAQLLQQLVGTLASRRPGATCRARRRREVLAGVEERHQVDRLEHEADLVLAELRQLLRVVVGDVLAADDDRALGGGDRMPPAIEHSVVLPEPGRADQRDDLVAAERERGVVEGDDLGAVTHRVHLADVVPAGAPWIARRWAQSDAAVSVGSRCS
jgi:hypothetical protein